MSSGDPLFRQHKYVVIKNMQEFNNSISSQFYFKLDRNTLIRDTLLFA